MADIAAVLDHHRLDEDGSFYVEDRKKDMIVSGTLTPGYFPTDLSHGLLNSRWGDDVRRRIPMRRTGEPQEPARAATFMLGDASSHMTGATITVDGGWLAW